MVAWREMASSTSGRATTYFAWPAPSREATGFRSATQLLPACTPGVCVYSRPFPLRPRLGLLARVALASDRSPTEHGWRVCWHHNVETSPELSFVKAIIDARNIVTSRKKYTRHHHAIKLQPKRPCPYSPLKKKTRVLICLWMSQK